MSFGGPTVPMAKVQLAQQSLQHGQQQPGTGEIHRRSCILLTVFDEGTIRDGTAPDGVLQRAEFFPNIRYGEVQLQNGQRLVLPFKESAAQLHSTYGNSLILEGSRANIEFYNTRIRAGVIVPQDDPAAIPADMVVATDVYDIGLIV